MRRRITLLVAAVLSAVILAFLVSLALLLGTLAEDRAIAVATAQSQTLLAVAQMASGSADMQRRVSTLIGARSAAVFTLYLSDGTSVGPAVDDPGVDQARRQNRSWTRRGNPTVVYTVSVARDDNRMVVRAEVAEAQLHQGVPRAVVLVAVLGLLLFVVAVAIADLMARRITRSLHALAVTADRMREGSLEAVVPEDGPKEVAAVAAALNRLGARVRQLVASERDAVADLSHRLRTPVTALRLDTEFVDDPDVAERLRGHVSQLERTVDAIVHDARRPSRSGQMTAASSDVGKVVGERVSFWSALAEDQGRPLRLALPDPPLRARLSENDLADVVDVLIDNVFAHTEDGTPVEIWVVPRADGAVVLTVEDAGPGLPSVDIINRGKSNAGSTGLGLDIVRRAAVASGGSLELGRSRLGGALVRLVLGRAED